jgi:hypothetical protein
MRWLPSLLLAATPPAALGQTRDFRTTDHMVLGAPADLTASIVFANVDGDGDQDALLANGRHWAQANRNKDRHKARYWGGWLRWLGGHFTSYLCPCQRRDRALDLEGRILNTMGLR